MRFELICDWNASQWFLTPDIAIWRAGNYLRQYGFAIQFLRGRLGFYFLRATKA